MEENHQINSEYWGAKYFAKDFNRRDYQSHPLAVENRNKLHDGMELWDWVAIKHLKGKTIQRGLGIINGDGETELRLIEMGAVEHFDLYAVNPIYYDCARFNAERKGIGSKVTCHYIPIHAAVLPDKAYGLVSFVATLHHTYSLEQTLQRINKSLKNDGILWGLNEYIGPDRFEFPPEHADLARAFYRTLPDRFKNPWFFSDIKFPTAAEVFAADPTESPSSSQVEAIMKKMYPKLEITPLYGSFAYMIFWGIFHDAIYSSAQGVELVRHILGMDRALVESNVLPNYFAHFVARKPKRFFDFLES